MYYFPGLSQIPDIIVTQDNYLLVLDAKNYVPKFDDDNKLSRGLPGTESIIKQIFYKYFLSREFNEDEKDSSKYHPLDHIINAFLIPSVDIENPIEYMGKHQFKDQFKDHLKNQLGHIYCFFVDFYELRKHYLKPNKAYQNKILGYIVEQFKEAHPHSD